MHSHDLLQEIKKVGPDLKEARQKLRKEWIPYWIGHTTEFRPTTKMPQFQSHRRRNPAHRRLHLAGFALRARARKTSPPETLPTEKSCSNDARLPRLPRHRRRRKRRRRHFRGESQPRRRKRKLRLSSPLGPQPAPALGALLPVRKKRSRSGRLRQAQSAVRLRSRPLALPERWPRTRRPAADRHAQPAPL